MRRSHHGIVLLLVLLAGTALVCGWRSASPDPVYEGRPLSQWLDGGYEQASMALHELGPAAVPCVFEKLRREHPAWGSRVYYRRAWEYTPPVLRRWLPGPRSAAFDEWRACQALVDIGPRAIPLLLPAARDRHRAVRAAAAAALRVFQDRGLPRRCANRL